MSKRSQFCGSRLFSLLRLLTGSLALLCLAPLAPVVGVQAQSRAVDPGVRPGAPGAGTFFNTLSQSQKAIGPVITQDFNNIFGVTTAETGNFGLGPRYNSNECELCHSQPAAGGSSTFTNQAFLVYNTDGATNEIPFFESSSGAMQNARFPEQSGDLSVPDGLVQPIYTITGRADAGTCDIAPANFSQAQSESNLTFRVPPPMFGDGLTEIILESDILSNQAVQCAQEGVTGICGTPNYASDGSIGRFGWKAQDRSALIFASEAFTGELGVTDEAFPNEGDETSGCVVNSLPEDHSNFVQHIPPSRFPGSPERLALFVRFLAPPTPAPPNSSTLNGQNQFNAIGCNACHTTSFVTPRSAISALSNQQANIFSDLLVHHMGSCLADGVTQGGAGGDMFRSAPLWGVGQRIFFMHDGRTSNIVQAVEDHSDEYCQLGSGSHVTTGNYPASEANAVIDAFNGLSTVNQQDLIDFLRSL
jgi:CxxC motif-containing protein (DUF1111 family)